MGLMANQTLQKKRLENCKTQQQKLIKTKHSKKKKKFKKWKEHQQKKRGGVDFKYPNIYILGFSETAEVVDRKSI